MKSSFHRIIVKGTERFGDAASGFKKALQIQIGILLYLENLLEIQIMPI